MKTLTGEQKKIYSKAISLSRGLYKNNFAELFTNDKHRIEIPLNNIDYTISNSYMIVNNYLTENGYEIIDYIGGYAAKKGDKNKFKIGKIIKHNKYLVTNFRDCIYRQKIKLVISRHPYDIACASWGQYWDSCLNIEDGFNKEAIYDMIIANSCMIAYTVSATNNTSLGRCFIIPYYNYESGTFWLYPASVPYGLFPKECQEFLESWLNENYNEKFIAPKLKSNGLVVNFNFPNNLVYDNDDCPSIKYYNYKCIDKTSIKKHLDDGSLVTILKDIYDIKGSYPDLNLIKSEIREWYDYHKSCGKSENSKIMKNCRYLIYWMDEEEPRDNDVKQYFNYLSKYKLLFKGSHKIQQYLSSNITPFKIDKYLKLINGKLSWDDIKKQIIEWGEVKFIRKDGALQKRMLKKLY
jgi:hypothetical protein